MKAVNLLSLDPAEEERRPLAISFVVALCVFLFAAALLSRKASAPPNTTLQILPVEAVMFEQPKVMPHLHQAPAAPHEKVHVEKAISTVASSSPSHPTTAPAVEQSNQLETSAGEVQTHGPQLIHSVTPKIPSYLKDQNLHVTVLIEFVIGADGKVVPHLIKTSGNEELDVLALKSAREWTFLPAKASGHAIDSSVRLRINFAVD